MVTAKLIFQSFAGLSAFGGFIGTGFLLNNSSNQQNNNIIVVFDGTIAADQASTVKKESYSCVITSETDTSITQIDKNCEVYKLEVSNTSTPTTFVNLKTTMVDDNKAETIETGKKYILKLDETKFNQIKGVNKKIEIKNAKGAKIVEFSPTAILSGTIKTPKTNLIIGQSFNLASTSVTVALAADNKYFCQFVEPTTLKNKFECDVYKPSTPKASNTFTDTDLAALAITTTPSEITKDKFFAIDFKEQKISVDELRNKRINLFSGTESSTATTNVATFSYEQALVGNLAVSTGKFAYRLSPGKETYYVTQLTTTPVDGLTTELFTTTSGDNSVEVQNYKCQVTGITNSEDATCKLFAMPTFDSTKKSTTLELVQAANTQIKEKTKLVKDAYFKLVINHSNLDVWTGADEKTVDLISTETEAKKYATLKVLAKENGTNPVGKTQYVVGKLSSTTAITDTTSTFDCQIEDSTIANSDCDIYKFTTAITSNQTYKDLNFSEATKTTTVSEIKADSYYLIDLKDKKFDFLTSKNKKILIYKKSGTTINFSINAVNPIIANITDTKANNTAIFLN